MIYRRSGRSGLLLPVLSVGLWQRFGGNLPSDENRAIVLRAFELGVTHFDLANNYGPPYGSAESMGALATAVHQGKALYVGISQYQPAQTREAAAILQGMGIRLLIHQPVYSMLNRWVEPELLSTLDELGVGCIAFSPLAQGMLTDKYLQGVPAGSRATQGYSLNPETVDQNMTRIRALNEIAKLRGQKLSQMALAWVLRDPRVTSAIVGVSSVQQLEENLGALDNMDFKPEDLREIDRILM